MSVSDQLPNSADKNAANGDYQPFAHITTFPDRSELRRAITRAWSLPETEAIPTLLDSVALPEDQTKRVHDLAYKIAEGLRNSESARGKEGLIQGLLQEFSLSSQEGIALMCLAEALLRVPDAATRNALIRDKLYEGDWKAHLGKSSSTFVNAAAWGLMITGKLVAPPSDKTLGAGLTRALGKFGEPLIRKGMDMAMRMMGEQFVTGETIEKAVSNAKRLEQKGFRYSYDMLGEAAMTDADAQRYIKDYETAIEAIGKDSGSKGVYEGPGISIKLSAIHPRYFRGQYDRVQKELYPVLLRLAKLAKQHNIGLNIDAEEVERLELSLDLLERLCFEPELQGWEGIGFVVQGYQKRCFYVIDYIVDLAKRSNHRLMIRLVKGAYWDTEIKRTQVEGIDDFPVFTRKPYTDISYVACARKLLDAQKYIYPQFATHNARTVATIYEMADPATYYRGQYEFQCLHGMGEPLYGQIVSSDKLDRPCRIYAPVGSHETLLAYLVRRLLENGANTSFVNQVADPSLPLESLILDPVAQAQRWAEEEGQLGRSHPHITTAGTLYGNVRPNSRGMELTSDDQLEALEKGLIESASGQIDGAPIVAASLTSTEGERIDVINPSDHSDKVGSVRQIASADVERAVQTAADFAPEWAAYAPEKRAEILDRVAALIEEKREELMGIVVREAGKTYSNALAEIREAVDFLYYYAQQVRSSFDNASHKALGPITCISPWNFPLAIFTGQVAAALAAGNTVLAKPAEQTTLIAIRAVELFLEAGIPREALQLIPGEGSKVGPLLTDDERIQGVMFTGSTEVARLLQRTLAKRLGNNGKPVPLIAETGGQNAMIVDSSALPEQVIRDVVMSAYDSAGQRCSALRVLCVQEDVAERTLDMLKGAMRELQLGDPMQLATDVGPVIDAEARDNINRHISTMRSKGRTVHQLNLNGESAQRAADGAGTYVPPTLIELDSIADLEREVFGPVLHVVRYKREHLGDLLKQIRDTGYGLTMGVHTRINETIDYVATHSHVGNFYVNRNMVGAIVGVQPFGGEGLSGTGPKAGGPLYLYRLLAERPEGVLAWPFGTRESTYATPTSHDQRSEREVTQLRNWASDKGIDFAKADEPFFGPDVYGLPGPTGEGNTYRTLPREAVLSVADTQEQYLIQLEAVVKAGSHLVWDASSRVPAKLYQDLPEALKKFITLSRQPLKADFEIALHHGSKESLLTLQQALAERDGAIVIVTSMGEGTALVPPERLMAECSTSVDTTAAGGNASLMTMD
ncbi:trifunctional transcriptional regulator/proline dehydrogenase/L-glutamate gamma-semialdehyde dehydrogenase [Carnimonas bestiolae]|uniref:trifunctional transcriptional regulator/proline dehydrogenase/L-glutamate gamma-semialdehyde dehydrogenase n=1 Tax=Carnimonas bestiolae TaxID=3402172 RepID=UPI003EDC0E10